ncbi:MAG: S9 family peptidase [Flavobacteriales bacterium]|nr:S9 family peptidase [Flavobacteriales bacterium]MBP9079400.1 S9 family peptidase [Flavobacteriales bacterium]
MLKFIPTAALVLSTACSALAQKPLTNEAIWYSRTFSGDWFSGGVSMADGLHYTALDEGEGGLEVNIYEYKTGKRTGTVLHGKDLVPGGQGQPLAMDDYALSGDERKVMVRTATEPLYRYSSYAYNFVYDLASKAVKALADTTKGKQRLATFSPDGLHAAFVRNNNLYTVELATMQETAVTTDGEWNKVINGATDWVYEEEFTLVQGYAWSPDGKRLLYLRSDESAVPEFDLTTYEDQLYPREYRFKYPKAGEANSTVSLHVYDLSSKAAATVPLGTSETDIYLPRFGFTNANTVWFMRMNRLQNEKLIYTCDATTASAASLNLIYKEISPTYIEVTDDLSFLNDGSFILTNEQDGWNHIVWNSADGQMQRVLTPGSYDVLEVQGVDEKAKRVFFTASKLAPTQQEVWSVGLNGKGLKQLSLAGGVNEAEFSTGFKYFINTRSTANDPGTIALHEGSGKLVKILKDNARLRETLKEYGLQPKELITVATSGGQVLNAWMVKPPGFDASKKYPVFMTQYSGPNSNSVLDRWGGRDFLWHQMLAQKGYIVVCADGRGTGHRGRDFRHVTYGQLGKYETEDQIAVAKWLGQLPYVDAARIGIQGWSYGGYMSSLCITKGADTFKAAIAVAPVTNWRYYDSIYTERYMGLPKDNATGYDDNSPINHVAELKGNYLLVHGLADDNVHFQNSAEMTTALVKANKQFTEMMYPDKNHGIYGGTTRLHLFTLMTDFVLEKL